VSSDMGCHTEPEDEERQPSEFSMAAEVSYAEHDIFSIEIHSGGCGSPTARASWGESRSSSDKLEIRPPMTARPFMTTLTARGRLENAMSIIKSDLEQSLT
jgi:hypothetical protein